jgi:hypothetical protein
VSLIEKGNERAKVSHGELSWKNVRWSVTLGGQDTINDEWSRRSHEDIWLSFELRKRCRIQANFGVKDYLLRNWGACVDTIFLEKQDKRIRRSSRWGKKATGLADGQRSSTLPIVGRLKRERKMVNRTHRWSKKFNSVDGLAGQTDRPMVNRRVADRKKRRRQSRRYVKRKAQRGRVNPRLTTGQESTFGEFLTLARSLFLFLVVFVFFRCK